MDFAKISGGIQVKLYTNKSYGDSVSVVKKSDNEYAILMPETSNSMTASPILNPVSSVVRGVSVKTQQYENGIKGYTKIIISTTAPIEIVPQVKAINVSDYQLSENDYSELLAQTSKKPKQVAVKKTTTKQITKAKPVIEKTAYTTPKKIKKTEPKQINQTKKIEKPIVKEIKKPVTPTIAPTVSKSVESAKPSQEAKPVETNVPNPSPTAMPTQNALPAPAQTAPAPIVQTPIQPAPKLTFTQKFINVAENPRLLAKYKDVVMNNIYMIGGGAILVFLLLLLGARRMTKGIQSQKETFTKNLNESPATTSNFMDKINENMTWKEKYQTYVEASNQSPEVPNEAPARPHTEPSEPIEPTPSPFVAEDELNELFEIDSNDNPTPTENNVTQEIPKPQPSIDEDILDKYEQLERDLIAETEVPQHEISGREDVFGKDRLDELFGKDENILGENLLGDDVFGEENGFIAENYSFNEPPKPVRPRASFYEPLNSEPAQETFTEPLINPYVEPYAGSYTEPISESFAQPAAESENYTKINTDEVEKVKSEYIIDEKRGFYLVDYKDSSALIGHIEDDVFLLKQFGKKIEGKLQARLDEHKGSSANYMTRVGDFKALVEVKPDNMNLLIEL